MINFDSNRENVMTNLSKSGLETWIECTINIESIGSDIELQKIPNAIYYSLNKKSGLPIGITLPTSENSIQNFTETEFISEIFGNALYNSYDYFRYSVDGGIFLISSVNENKFSDFEFRIKRVTELIQFIRNYYVFWIISHEHKISIDLKYRGIMEFQNFYKENTLVPSNENIYKTSEIKFKTTMEKLFYNFREEAFKISGELFSPFGNILNQEIKMKEWITQVVNSNR